jgi:hypothetical protein
VPTQLRRRLGLDHVVGAVLTVSLAGCSHSQRVHYYQELTARLKTKLTSTVNDGEALVAADEEEEARLEVAVHAVIQAIVWRIRVDAAEGLLADGEARANQLPM